MITRSCSTASAYFTPNHAATSAQQCDGTEQSGGRRRRGRDLNRDLWVMSKTVPIYGGSSSPCSPACALLHAPRCLTASQVAPPVHGVSTTRATTPKPPPGLTVIAADRCAPSPRMFDARKELAGYRLVADDAPLAHRAQAGFGARRRCSRSHSIGPGEWEIWGFGTACPVWCFGR
jgi:hypothetical protein